MRLRNRHLLIADAVLLCASSALAFAARFESTALPAPFAGVLIAYIAASVPLRLLAFVRLGVYARLWRYAGQSDIELLCVASLAAALIGAAVGLAAVPLLPGVATRVPLSVLALDALLGAAVLTLPRLALRQRRRWGRRASDRNGTRRALVAGAGAAGAMIVREMLQHEQLGLVPVALVDDDLGKQHRRLQGVPIVGSLADIPAIARRLSVDEIVIAMPAAPGAAVRRVVQSAAEVGLPARTVPGLYELLSGRKAASALRQVQIEDLLRRDPVSTDLERVRALAHDKVVLVTGAGGSIGSELCRQLASLGPAHLLVLGRGENSVFELLQELSAAHPGLSVEPVIADIRDRARLERVMQAARPHSVFHAAAHKHVPLMEQNVAEAILNNVLGTQTVAELAAQYGAERFVLISSDKAVRPSSVMGATKRLAEGVIQRIGRESACAFVAVRFGNVLGSRGSVIPTFLRQIQRGGPVTITHPDMTRYFMTIPEAVQLVLQAGVMGEGGEVFVLDMGEPVRVLDLARDLIRLSGLSEDDVEIRFTGMRPGEKLFEELFFNEESASPTSHPKVLRALNARFTDAEAARLPGLIGLARRDATADELRRHIHALVPEYTGAGVAAAACEPARAATRPGAPAWGAEVGGASPHAHADPTVLVGAAGHDADDPGAVPAVAGGFRPKRA